MQPGQDENTKRAYNMHATRPGRKHKTCIQYAYSRDGIFLRLVSLSYIHVWIKNNKDLKNEKKVLKKRAFQKTQTNQTTEMPKWSRIEFLKDFLSYFL